MPNESIVLYYFNTHGSFSPFFLKSQSNLEKFRIFSIQSKQNQDNIRKNHTVLDMAKLAVIRRDLQCQK